MFKPTLEWASELCRRLRYESAESALVISAVEAPPDVSPTGRVSLLLEFGGGRCVRAALSPEPQEGDYVLEGAYLDYLKDLRREVPALCCLRPGQDTPSKGVSLNSPTTCL